MIANGSRENVGWSKRFTVMLGPLVHRLLWDKTGALDLAALQSLYNDGTLGNWRALRDYLVDQAALNDGFHFRAPYAALLREKEYEPLFKALFAQLGGPQVGVNAGLLDAFQARLVDIDEERYVSRYFGNASGRAHLQTILKDMHQGPRAFYYSRGSCADFVKAIAYASKGLVAETEREEMTAELSLWNYANIGVSKDETRAAAEIADRILTAVTRLDRTQKNADVNADVVALSKRELLQGYKQAKALSRLGSVVAAGLSNRGDSTDIRYALHELENRPTAALYRSLVKKGILYKGLQAAEMDGGEALIGMLQSTALAIAIGLVVRKKLQWTAIAEPGIRAALTRAGRAWAVGSTLSVVENTIAVATGETRQWPEHMASWAIDAFATGTSMGIIGFIPPSRAVGDFVHQYAARYLKQGWFLPVDSAAAPLIDTVTEGLDYYLNQGLKSGDWEALSWSTVRETAITSVAGGGFKVGAVAEIIKGKEPSASASPKGGGSEGKNLEGGEQAQQANRLSEMLAGLRCPGQRKQREQTSVPIFMRPMPSQPLWRVEGGSEFEHSGAPRETGHGDEFPSSLSPLQRLRYISLGLRARDEKAGTVLQLLDAVAATRPEEIPLYTLFYLGCYGLVAKAEEHRAGARRILEQLRNTAPEGSPRLALIQAFLATSPLGEMDYHLSIPVFVALLGVFEGTDRTDISDIAKVITDTGPHYLQAIRPKDARIVDRAFAVLERNMPSTLTEARAGNGAIATSVLKVLISWGSSFPGSHSVHIRKRLQRFSMRRQWGETGMQYQQWLEKQVIPKLGLQAETEGQLTALLHAQLWSAPYPLLPTHVATIAIYLKEATRCSVVLKVLKQVALYDKNGFFEHLPKHDEFKLFSKSAVKKLSRFIQDPATTPIERQNAIEILLILMNNGTADVQSAVMHAFRGIVKSKRIPRAIQSHLQSLLTINGHH